MPRSINNFAACAVAWSFLSVAVPVGASAGTPGSLPHDVLARLVRVCAPQVDSTTQAAIVAVESGGSSLVLHDDNDDRVYSPATRPEAESILAALSSRDRKLYGRDDHGIDVGLAQINTNNLDFLGVAAPDLLDPCTNLHASARIIADAYVRERAMLAQQAGWRGDELALRRALQVYNSGRPDGDDAYVRAVYATLDGALVRDVGSSARVPTVPVVPLQFALQPATVSRASAKRSTRFYHASWSAPSPSPKERGVVLRQ